MYLAENFLTIGPYFGDLGGSNWPNVPLHKKPIPLEKIFHQLLTNLTFAMSNGAMENVSLLDLPAFGHTIETLRMDLKKQFNWPIETNHAYLTQNQNLNMSSLFMEYKTLMEDWGQYMDQLDKHSNDGYFTNLMQKNKHLNFTRFIVADMNTFLFALSGNLHTYV